MFFTSRTWILNEKKKLAHRDTTHNTHQPNRQTTHTNPHHTPPDTHKPHTHTTNATQTTRTNRKPHTQTQTTFVFRFAIHIEKKVILNFWFFMSWAQLHFDKINLSFGITNLNWNYWMWFEIWHTYHTTQTETTQTPHTHQPHTRTTHTDTTYTQTTHTRATHTNHTHTPHQTHKPNTHTHMPTTHANHTHANRTHKPHLNFQNFQNMLLFFWFDNFFW